MNWNEFEPYSTVKYYYNYIDPLKMVDIMKIMDMVNIIKIMDMVDYLNMMMVDIMVYLELLVMAFKLIMVV